MYIQIKYKTLLCNMYLELGENLTQGYFALQNVLVTLVNFGKKYQNLVEIIAVFEFEDQILLIRDEKT